LSGRDLTGKLHTMLRVAVLVVVSTGCASQPLRPRAIVSHAAAALGGTARIAAVRTLTLEGSGTTGSFGQSVVPGGDPPLVDVTHVRRTMDLAHDRWRQQQTQARRLPSPNTVPVTYAFGVAGALAYTIDDEGSAALDSPAIAAERRAEMRHHPLGLVRAALAPTAVLANPRHDHGLDIVDITLPEGTFTLAIDPHTGLPAHVASRAYDPVVGDIVIETTFARYERAGGLVLPTQLAVRRDGQVVSSLTVANTLEASDDTSAPASPSSRAEPAVAVEPLADGVWLLGGSSHHSVLIELADRAVLVEVPRDEARTLAVITDARRLLAAKPLTHAIMSHHHHDHAAGVRAAVAERLTIVADESARAFVTDLVGRRHALAPDTLARRPSPLILEVVADRRTYGDGAGRIEVYPVSGNAHASSMLMVYVPHARMLITADLFDRSSTGVYPFAANLVDNVDRRGLEVDVLVGLHGRPVPFGEVRAAANPRRSTGGSGESAASFCSTLVGPAFSRACAPPLDGLFD
jgi:glyoxylase-like metal-dependent hydrolase (beta-lactamase superfamily II)